MNKPKKLNFTQCLRTVTLWPFAIAALGESALE